MCLVQELAQQVEGDLYRAGRGVGFRRKNTGIEKEWLSLAMEGKEAR